MHEPPHTIPSPCHRSFIAEMKRNGLSTRELCLTVEKTQYRDPHFAILETTESDRTKKAALLAGLSLRTGENRAIEARKLSRNIFCHADVPTRLCDALSKKKIPRLNSSWNQKNREELGTTRLLLIALRLERERQRAATR